MSGALLFSSGVGVFLLEICERWSASGWNDDERSAAPARLAFEPRAPAMEFREPAHECQTETCTAGLSVVTVVDLVEGRKDLVEFLARDPRSVITNSNLKSTIAGRASNNGYPA